MSTLLCEIHGSGDNIWWVPKGDGRTEPICTECLELERAETALYKVNQGLKEALSQPTSDDNSVEPNRD